MIINLVFYPESKSNETWTTETPLHLQTPDPTDETDVKGEKTVQICEEERKRLQNQLTCCF